MNVRNIFILYSYTLCFEGLATFFTALFVRNVFHYNWDWNVSMMFGALISATDPVAVVALLKDLGLYQNRIRLPLDMGYSMYNTVDTCTCISSVTATQCSGS